MRTCGTSNIMEVARLCYRHTFGMVWLFFSRLAFIATLFMIIAKHIVLLRTKLFVSSLHVRRFFMIFLIGLLIGAYLPDTAWAGSEKMAMITSQVVLLLAEGNVMVKAAGSGKWREAIVGMRLGRGDSIKTGPSSWAGIATSNLKYPVTIKEKTSVDLIDFSPICIPN